MGGWPRPLQLKVSLTHFYLVNLTHLLIFRAQGGGDEIVRFWMASFKMGNSQADREMLSSWYDSNRNLIR